jgi:hypothetical protein
MTADGRAVPVKVYSTVVRNATTKTAPYIIPANAFGVNAPPAELRLSPMHAFQIRKGVWQTGQQYAIGEDVTYYHLECPNYFRDNLVANGCVVESFGARQAVGIKQVYTPCPRLGGYTRVSGSATKSNISHC